MNKEAMLNALDANIIAKFRTAIELGKWEDGRKLTQAQKETCMQAVLLWEHENLPETERTGYIHKPKKDEACASHSHHETPEETEEKPIKFS